MKKSERAFDPYTDRVYPEDVAILVVAALAAVLALLGLI